MLNKSPRGQSWLERLRQLNSIQVVRREPGQIIVLFAVFVIVLMVLAGSAYDYASIVVDDAQLQNAIDAAVLAGSNTLAQNATLPTGTPAAMAQATAVAYLAQNGAATQTPGTTVNITFPTSTPVGSGTPSALVENMSISVNRNHSTSFWPLIGINSVNMRGSGAAHSARSMLDVFLSLDTTGSLVLSGNLYDNTSHSGGWTVRDALSTFITTINPTTSDPRGPKIGIGRYAGIQCTWYDDNSNGVMDVYSGASPQSEYRAPCTDDETILTTFTNDPNLLLTIANNQTPALCPAVAVGYACPIQHHPYTLSYGGLALNGSIILPVGPYYTGTKEPNAICLVNPGDALCPEAPSSVSGTGFAWSTANGARNCTSWPCPTGTLGNQARRVQVIMTDGQDEAWPTAYVGNPINPDPAFPESIPGYDTNFKQLATNIKANPAPDGGPGVEIFVVGYFCTGPPGVGPSTYQSNQYPPSDFCQSKIAYTSAPRACPGPVYYPNPNALAFGSPVDDLLVAVSSSTPGTCDHYFPMSKNESLSTLFADLAGTISRGQLTQ